jgi:hypothetical protein
MDFLVSENILICSDESPGSFASEARETIDGEKLKLYKTTCEVLGQYWQQPAPNELKVSGVFNRTPDNNQTEYKI